MLLTSNIFFIIKFDIFLIAFIYIESAERRCSSEGHWESRLGEPDPVGWTNFTPCFRPEVNILLKKIYAGGNNDVGKVELHQRDN